MLTPLLVVFGLLALTGVVAGVATLLVVYSLPADATVARRSAAKQIVMALSHGVGIAGIIVTGAWEPVLEVIVYDAPPLDPGVAGIGVFVLGSVVALPGIVLSHSITGIQQMNVDGEGSVATVLTLAAKDAFGVATLLGLVVLAFVGIVAAPHPAIAVLVPVVAAYVGAQLLAYGVRWGQPIREPTNAERKRMAQALDYTGFPVRRVHVVVDQPEVELPRPFARGLWPRSHVFVPENSLETMEPAVLETILVQATTTSGFRELRIAARSLLFGMLVTMFVHFDALALYTSDAPESPIAIAGLVVALILTELLAFVIGHRLIYRGDRQVATMVGTEQFRTAIEQQFERSGGEEIDRLSRYILLIPSVQQRLQRLGAGE